MRRIDPIENQVADLNGEYADFAIKRQYCRQGFEGYSLERVVYLDAQLLEIEERFQKLILGRLGARALLWLKLADRLKYPFSLEGLNAREDS